MLEVFIGCVDNCIYMDSGDVTFDEGQLETIDATLIVM